MNTKPQRSQKRSSTKRKTIHLVLWVNPIVKAHLQRVAAQEGLSMSKAGGVLLSRALQQNIDVTTPSAFLLTASRETHTLWVTLPPDGSVRAGEFLTQPHDPGKLTGGRWDNDATCSAASWELLAHKYIVGLCHVGLPSQSPDQLLPLCSRVLSGTCPNRHLRWVWQVCSVLSL